MGNGLQTLTTTRNAGHRDDGHGAVVLPNVGSSKKGGDRRKPELGNAIAAPAAKVTARELRNAIETKWTSPRYEVVHEVRNEAGFDATRSCDTMVMSTWPADGLLLQGIEIKVSRADFLKEVKDPWKAEAFSRYCDLWSLVVPNADIVKPGELPEGVGLYILSKATLKCVTKPAKRQKVEPLPRGMLALMLRRSRESQHQLLTAARSGALERAREESAARDTALAEKLEALKQGVATFEAASGVKLSEYNARKVGSALKATLQYLDDGYAGPKAQLRRAIEVANKAAASCEDALKSFEQLAAEQAELSPTPQGGSSNE